MRHHALHRPGFQAVQVVGEQWSARALSCASLPGVFAAGDVRHGSTKRVAGAVGDGSVAIRLVHEYLTR